MKIKLLLLSAVAMLTMTNANAQDTDKRFFNHVAVGVDAGLQGFGFDVAMPVCKWVSVRAGVSIFPKINVNTSLKLAKYVTSSNLPANSGVTIPEEVDIKAKTGFTNGKILFDLYPFASKVFHFTVGAYFGSSKIVEAYNTNSQDALKVIHEYNKTAPDYQKAPRLGNFVLDPDENGNINASIKTASFKPYLGLGFGRSVPKKRRLGFMFEMGCQFWGSPKVYCNDQEVKESDLDGEDGGAIKFLSKVTVYPVMSFRLCGRIL